MIKTPSEELTPDQENSRLVKPRERADGEALEKSDEPPVVARLIIEIRSDGSRTIARGAMEDVQSGEKAAIEAQGTTPMALAASLTKSLLTLPLLARDVAKGSARNAVKALLGRGKRGRDD